jgi:integrase
MQPVVELFKEYLSVGGYAESTIDSKKRALKFWPYGSLDVKVITLAHAEDYQKKLRQGGKRVAKTVNLYVTHIRDFFNWCKRHKYVEDNPFEGLKDLPAVDRKMPSFSDDELIRMINVAKPRWKAIICFGAMGLRETEMLNLKWEDLKFDKQQILITPKKNTKDTWAWSIKNYKQAYASFPFQIVLPDVVVPFHDVVRSLRTAECPYVCQRPKYYKKLIEKHRQGKLYYRKKLTPWGNFDRDFKRLLKKAGVSPKSFQDMRRTFAEKLKSKGYDLQTVQMMMRHSSIETTARFYLNVEEQEVVASVNRMFSTL